MLGEREQRFDNLRTELDRPVVAGQQQLLRA